MNDLPSIVRFMETFKELVAKKGVSMTLEEKATAGLQIDAIAKSASETLEILRELLRDEAFQICKGKVKVCQLTPDCWVKYPNSTMKLKNGVDLGNLQKVLGDDYGDVIETTVTLSLRKDAQEKIVENPKYLDAVMEVVDLVVGLPRVFFKRGG